MRRCAVIADRSPDPGHRAVRDADWVVPLFAEGIFALALCGERLITPGEILERDAFGRIATRALAARDRFIELACGDELLDGIDLATVFACDELLLLFRDMVLAQELGRELRRQGFGEVTFVPGRTAAGAPVAEAFAAALAAALAPAMAFVRAAEVPHLRSFGERLTYPWRKARRLLAVPRRPRPCRCAAIFPGRQWQRFEAPLLDLRRRFGRDLSFWYLGSAGRDLRAFLRRHQISLEHVPFPRRVDEDIVAFFSGRWQAWQSTEREELAARVDCPILADDGVGDLFRTSYAFTLPRTAQWARDLRFALADARPQLIVGSAAYTAATSLPFAAAAAVDVPSIALSHTYVSGDNSPIGSRYLACRNSFERSSYRRSFPENDRVLYCRNASDVVSYRVEEAGAPASGAAAEERVVALLTAAPSYDQHALPILDVGEYARALRAALRPPEDLAGIRFVWKFHPRLDLSPLLARWDLPANVRIFPSHGSVHDLLAGAWLKVLFNHYGGVAVDAALAGGPVVRFDSAGFFFPHVDPASFTAAAVVETLEELWQLIRDLVADPSRQAELALRCRDFCRDQLAPAAADLADLLPPDRAG